MSCGVVLGLTERHPCIVEVLAMAGAVDAYLARAPEQHRIALNQLREAIKSVVPDAEETIRTRVPAFRYRGRPLVSIGASQRHISLFIMYGRVLKEHAAALGAYDTSNTVVGFDPGRPVPIDIVTRLVRARAAEIDAI
jgi:uncharacterized protein YdhG (YjbR/CyaY superfamily)